MFFIAMLVVVVTWAVGNSASSPRPTRRPTCSRRTAQRTANCSASRCRRTFPNNLREFDGPDSLGPPNLLLQRPARCAGRIVQSKDSTAADLVGRAVPAWYYGVVGVPVAVAGQSESVFAYRLVSAVLCVALLTLAMCLGKRACARRCGRVAARRADTDGAVPDGIGQSQRDRDRRLRCHLGVPDPGRRRTSEVPSRILVLASVLSAAVVLMRPIAIVWMVAMVTIVLIGTSAERRRELMSRRLLIWSVGPTAIALLASWAWALYAGIEVKDERLTNTLGLGAALRQSVDNWGRYVRQTIGVLGWLDTTLPRSSTRCGSLRSSWSC